MATTHVEVGLMTVAQIPKPGMAFQIVERQIPEPDAGQVRIKVNACGVCHSDALTVEGSLPFIQYPRIPGHEVAGVIDELGTGVSAWKKGQRVKGYTAVTWDVSTVSPRRSLRDLNPRHQLRWRLSAVHGGF